MKSQHVYTVEGIILKRKAAGEADRILTVFTKYKGKIRVLAKGIRKIRSRRAGHVELFTRAILTLHAHASLDIVSEASTNDYGWRFEDNPGKIAYAYCMCELIDQLLPDGQENEDIYDMLVSSFQRLSHEHDEDVMQEQFGEFVHELLWRLGFLPQSRKLRYESLASYIEQITERRLRTWPLLAALRN